MAQQTNDFSQGSIPKNILALALPMTLAQLINVLYSVVDRIYLGLLPGHLALTGLGLTVPVISIIMGFANLCGTGGAPLSSMERGRGNREEAERVMGNAFTLLLIFGAAVTALFLVIKRPMLYLFGASDATYPYADAYMTIYLTGTLFVMIGLGMNPFINAQGYATMGMLTVIIGAGTNIILDPILMFGFDMGVQGAALATIISQGLSAAWILIFLSSRRSFLKLKLCNLRISPAILAPCIALGASPFVMQFTESILNICFNVSLRAYGGDIAVGVMAVLSSVMQFALLPITGMTQGSQPIVSYNYGAGKLDRVRSAFFNLLKCSVAYAVILWALAMLFPQIFMHMFTTDPKYIAMGTWAMRVYTAGICVMGVQYACQQTFVALGNARTSLCLALLRKVILLIPLIFILPHILTDHKVFAVFLAEPVADILAAATTAALFFRYLKKIMKSGGKQKG